MMTPEENDLLCRVEGDAPMGQIMRRHWIAACLSEEVAEPDGAPVKVRLLGEDLVVFRDSKGRVGVLDEYCSHRRASLVFARNEECGLRCLYHGWKFDVEGNVVEMASEPERQPHSRARQAQGLSGARGRRLRVVLYGPARGDARIRSRRPSRRRRMRASAPPRCGCAATGRRSSKARSTRRTRRACIPPTWCRRRSMAPRRRKPTGCGPRPTRRRASRSSAPATASATRRSARPIKNEATHDYIRTTVYIAPFTALIPPNNVHNVATLLTPEDDHTTIFYFIAWNGADKPGIDADAWRKFNVLQWGVDVDRNFDGMRTRDNLYGRIAPR